MMIHGRAAPRAMIVPPLFVEANFTRSLIIDVARRLADAGIGVAIPDLPGTGESLLPIETIDWHDWRAAIAAAAAAVADMAGTPPHLISIRGGALLDDACVARSRWRLAPASGASLIRQLERAQAIGDKEAGRSGGDDAVDHVELAGYRIGRGLRGPLREALAVDAPGALRIVPFEGPGIAPWRRAEPAGDAALAERVAADIVTWIDTCER